MIEDETEEDDDEQDQNSLVNFQYVRKGLKKSVNGKLEIFFGFCQLFIYMKNLILSTVSGNYVGLLY